MKQMWLGIFGVAAKWAKGVGIPVIVPEIVFHIKHSCSKFKQDRHKVRCKT
jgi:hypothetical protein